MISWSRPPELFRKIYSSSLWNCWLNQDVLLSFDDGPGPYQHFTSSRFRAVEQGLPVLRSANTGISAIIDPFGRIIDKLNIKDKGYLKSSLPMKITPTLYSKIGDFSLFAVIILYFIFLFVNFRRESPKA